MTRFGFIVLAVILVVTPGRLSGGPLAAESEPAGPPPAAAVKRTLKPFLRALRRGDLHRMQRLMTPALYAQYRTLFEQNRKYPAYLRKFYRGAKLSVRDVAVGQDEATAEIPISWPDERTTTVRIIMTRDALERWRISRMFE